MLISFQNRSISVFKLLCAISLFALVLQGGQMAQAQGIPSNGLPPSAFSILENNIVIELRNDGTWEKEEKTRWRINNAEGLKQIAQPAYSYSKTLEDFEILEAYITDSNGSNKKIVTPDKIITQQSPQSINAPMFADVLVKTVVYPSVSVGSLLYIHSKRTIVKPLFPNRLSASELFSRRFHFLGTTITVRAPSDMKVQFDAKGLNGGKFESTDPGINQWRWTLTQAPAQLQERYSVGDRDISPYLGFTNFDNLEQFAEAYAKLSRPKAVVTEPIRVLANNLTKGITDPRAQAEAIYNWVSKEIRYVAIFLGIGGWEPHAADDILMNRYGDCKDHVVLLEALLEAKGIRSSPVLINAAFIYGLPNTPAYVGFFDHAITYLPDFKIFVDSTAQVARFGVLPLSQLSKSALVIDDGSGKAVLLKTPSANAESNRVQSDMALTLDSNGNWRGSAKVVPQGYPDYNARLVFGLVGQNNTQFVANMLTATGQSGSGSYAKGDRLDLSKPYNYTTNFEIISNTPIPGPGAFSLPRGLGSLETIGAVADSASTKTRHSPLVLNIGTFQEATRVDLPTGIKVQVLPKDIFLKTKFGTYESTKSQQGDVLLIVRTLKLDYHQPVVQPQDYNEFYDMMQAVQRDLRAQFLYRPSIKSRH